jgi:preprotein translocase subunit YajC
MTVLGSLVAVQIGGGGSSLPFVGMMAIMLGVFYVLLILPQQRRQKKWQAMLDSLKAGDKVVTSGGLKGTIFAMKDDSITLRIPPDNLKLEVTRASIVSVSTTDEPGK